jgi:nitroreductase
MELQAAIRTTGSVRQFTNEPIDDATVYAMLDDARFAPSGGNRQGWRVVIIKDSEARTAIGDLMRPVWDEYFAIAATGRTPFTSVDPSAYELGATRAGAVANDLIEQIVEIPVVLVIAIDLSFVSMMDQDLDRAPVTGGGSIYPFCWNLLLSARSRGLGGVMTTFLARAERAAADLLALPPTWAIASTIFLGRPVHQPTKLKRRSVEEFTFVDRFDGPAFAPPP